MQAKLLLISMLLLTVLYGCEEETYNKMPNTASSDTGNSSDVMVTEDLELYNFYHADPDQPVFLATEYGDVYSREGVTGLWGSNAVDIIFLGDTLCSSRYLHDRDPTILSFQRVHHTAFLKVDLTDKEFEALDQINEVKEYIPQGQAEGYGQRYFPLNKGDFIGFLCCLRHGGVLKIEALSKDKITVSIRVIKSVD